MINKKNESLIDWIHTYDIDTTQRTIYLHSQDHSIEDAWSENGVEFKMATKFIKNVNYLNSLGSSPIKVIMSSCGGCWNFGMMIYDVIKQSKSPIDIYAYAHARSMTSIILQAARTRYISKHCDFMIHYGEYSESGDMRKVISGMEFYRQSNKKMFDLYAERCISGPIFRDADKTKAEVSDFLEQRVNNKVDAWFTAEQAVEFGFADEVF